MNDTTYTDWALVSLSPLPQHWQVILICSIVIATLVVVRSYRDSKRQWAMTTIRILCGLLVIGMLVEPALQTRVVRKIKNHLAIVIDQSLSMSLPSKENSSRADAVRAFLKTNKKELEELSQDHVVEFYNLNGPISEASIQQAPHETTTDLMRALQNVQNSKAGTPLAGIVLITDGADLGSLKNETPPLLSAAALQELQGYGVPINTISAAEVEDFSDIAIAGVVSDEFAFVHNTMEIHVDILATGMPQLTTPISLKRGNELISTQQVSLAKNTTTSVVFKTKPDKIGEFIYTVSIPAISGEALTENNQSSFAIKVIRDKIRVLQVAGKPSWDERFLRQHLKENPNVDLISFFILRTPTDPANVPEKEMSLIPFPVDKIFDTELHTFDVVIFQNFDYRPYPMERFLPNIRNAVENGLGFVMIGGDQSFSGGGYQGTAIDGILPVSLEDHQISTASSALHLTPAGSNHPVTQLLRSPSLNAKQWQALPKWSMINHTGPPLPMGSTLVESPTLANARGRPLPLISVREVGQGRSLSIASDSMWKWRFTSNRDGGASERSYHRFWSNALRWLVRDPAHSRVQVLPAKHQFEANTEISVAFRVLGPDYQPVSQSPLRVSLELAGGSTQQIDDLVTDDSGNARLQYKNLNVGAYTLHAEAPNGHKHLGKGHGVFIVQAESPELSQASPQPELLKAISKATNGSFGDLRSNLSDELETVNPDVIEIDRQKNVELWDNGWALTLGILLFGLDWALRRRNGYL